MAFSFWNIGSHKYCKYCLLHFSRKVLGAKYLTNVITFFLSSSCEIGTAIQHWKKRERKLNLDQLDPPLSEETAILMREHNMNHLFFCQSHTWNSRYNSNAINIISHHIHVSDACPRRRGRLLAIRKDLQVWKIEVFQKEDFKFKIVNKLSIINMCVYPRPTLVTFVH